MCHDDHHHHRIWSKFVVPDWLIEDVPRHKQYRRTMWTLHWYVATTQPWEKSRSDRSINRRIVALDGGQVERSRACHLVSWARVSSGIVLLVFFQNIVTHRKQHTSLSRIGFYLFLRSLFPRLVLKKRLNIARMHRSKSKTNRGWCIKENQQKSQYTRTRQRYETIRQAKKKTRKVKQTDHTHTHTHTHTHQLIDNCRDKKRRSDKRPLWVSQSNLEAHKSEEKENKKKKKKKSLFLSPSFLGRTYTWAYKCWSIFRSYSLLLLHSILLNLSLPKLTSLIHHSTFDHPLLWYYHPCYV